MDEKKINQGITWSIGPQILSYICSLLFTSILSRLVLPEEYGLINMVNTVTAFFIIFADGGLSWSVIQKKEILPGQVSNLFWVNFLAGLVLSILSLLSSPFIADFYGYKELEPLMSVMALNFLFSGVMTLGTSWLKRNLEFKKLAVIEIGSLLVSGVVAISMAFNGCGYWSLAALAIVKSGLKALAVVILTHNLFRLYDQTVSIRGLLNFSIFIQAYGVIGYLYKNVDSVAIAKIWGSEEVALYVKAQFLMNLPNMVTVGALGGFMIALLSRYQNETDKFHQIYLRCLRIIIAIAAPAGLLMVFLPEKVILFLYGDTWLQVVPILQAFTGAILLLPIYGTASWLFLSRGYGPLMVYWGLLSAALYMTAVYLAIDGKSVGVAAAYSVVMLILTLVTLGYAHYKNKMKILATIREVVKSYFAPLVAMIIVKYVSGYYEIESIIYFIIFYGLLYLCIYALLLLLQYKTKINTAFLLASFD